MENVVCIHLVFFHICKNNIFDPMHDILCGIGPMILKLVLVHYFIELKFFKIEDFNNRLNIISIWLCRKKKISLQQILMKKYWITKGKYFKSKSYANIMSFSCFFFFNFRFGSKNRWAFATNSSFAKNYGNSICAKSCNFFNILFESSYHWFSTEI